jgi:hypothetical protein
MTGQSVRLIYAGGALRLLGAGLDVDRRLDLGSRSLDRRAEFPRFFRRLQRTDFGRVSRSGLGL